ncbi:carbohydrate ABC transporter permease [Brachyspira pilosicoli]|uniref:carbohydrate ABC transporter permease n=1 Tax=Brachyspira pilosicoli TaxID=52584 RepID=UPI003006CCC4
MNKKKVILLSEYAALILYYLIFFIPVLWVFYSSFRLDTALFSGKIFQNDGGLTLKHYKDVLFPGADAGSNFPIYTFNSFKIAFIAVLVVVFVGLTGAYVLSRYRMKYKNALMLTLMSSQMFPGVLVLLSLFSFFYKLNLTDSIFAIALGHAIGGIPFALMMMKSYIDAIPVELDESGRIDGLSASGILFRIILPLAAPGIAVAAFYAFMASWGDYMYSLVLSTSLHSTTLPLGLARYFSSQQIKWGLINAATIVSILPTVVIFAMLQRQVVSGLTSGAVKG